MTPHYQTETCDASGDRIWDVPHAKPGFRQASVTPAFIAIEISALTLSCVAGDSFYHVLAYSSFGFSNRPIDAQTLTAIGLMMASLHAALLRPYGSYRLVTLASEKLAILRPLLTWTLVFLFFAAFVFILKVGSSFSRGAMLSFYILGLGVIAGLRLGLRPLLRRAIGDGRLQGHRLVILGDTQHWADAGTQDAMGLEGARVLATFHVNVKENGREAFERDLDGSLRRLVAFSRTREVDKILLALPWS